jgi:hypothetical protein
VVLPPEPSVASWQPQLYSAVVPRLMAQKDCVLTIQLSACVAGTPRTQLFFAHVHVVDSFAVTNPCHSVLQGLLGRVLDQNKHVQEAACSALATLEEQAGPELLPRLRVG